MAVEPLAAAAPVNLSLALDLGVAERQICGVDEAGRGPLAGAVYAAAVVLNPGRPIDGLADSKVLSANQRQALATQIRDHALAWAIASSSVEEIDRLNILRASLLAMRRAVLKLRPAPLLAKVDGNQAPRLPCAVELVIGGDAIVPAISAASILAKVARDLAMLRCHRRFPVYGFDQHKGYGTQQHLRALAQFGPCPVHRGSFAPVRAVTSRSERAEC